MKKVFILFLLCLIIAPSLTNCHPANQKIIKEKQASDLGYQLIVDEHTKIFLPIDEDAYEVELALSYVHNYLSGEVGLDDTLNKVRALLERLEVKLNTLENYTILPQLYERLLQYDMADLEKMADNMPNSEKAEFQRKLPISRSNSWINSNVLCQINMSGRLTERLF